MDFRIVLFGLLILAIAMAYVCIRLTSLVDTTIRDMREMREEVRRFFP